MKQIANFLFSPKLMAIVLVLFAVSIATATFIENDFGSDSARAFVYNARWFELLLMLGAINLFGNIFRKELYTRPKRTIFIFHLAFIVILAGAAITRYTGYEGTLVLREGQSSDTVLINRTYIQVTSRGTDNTEKFDYPVFFSALGRNKFKKVIRCGDQSFTLTCKSFIPNAIPDIEPVAEGKPIAEIIFTDSTGRKSLFIKSGDTKSIGTLMIAFDAPVTDSQTIRLTARGDSLKFIASYPVSLSNMTDKSFTILKKLQPHQFNPLQLYTFNGNMLVLNKYYSSGKLIPKSLPKNEGETYDALIMKLTSGADEMEFVMWGKNGYKGNPEMLSYHGYNFSINYGSVYKKIPFKLKLNDFIIYRYPGSQSPSSFESFVTLSDEQRNFVTSQRIYMNNILKYRGFRFYQSSYDPDEKGTVLSVNHDRAGTFISYIGYLLMGLGMVFSLFNADSRFRALSIEINRLKNSRKTISVIFFLLLLKGLCLGQNTLPDQRIVPINQQHASIFGKLLIQDNNGRIEPVNTLSSEVLRKIYRKSTYKSMNPDQVFLGMMVNPSVWQHEPIIRATHPQILKIMGSGNKCFSFSSFFKDNRYILQNYVEEAFRKKPAFRSKFDNEIIRLDERINISYLIFSGEFLRIFPVAGDSSYTWYNHQGIQGRINNEDSLFVENILYLYIQDVQKSIQTGDWTGPDDILKAISDYQMRYSGGIIPSPHKVSVEIFLNKLDVFSRISKFYGLIGLILLVLQFIGLFYARFKLKVPVIISIIFIISLFIIHSSGLALRWCVSGHAPWSNGYEALTYVAWATVLAGLIFSSKSAITLSVTSILAFMILFVAHLSWMDPQITNLVPVLKSYWLVIHVATITASYGFLALGALLAFIDIVLMIMQTRNNKEPIQLTIQELSKTIEMSLIIGLYLLTIGVFLGAVWANESWGRYWGWDPKETWALVTVLVYAFILHMQMVPGLKGVYAFNLASLLGFGSVIMTYFGVNYYLSGLHSYAMGDPIPIPTFLYYILTVVFVTAVLAYINNRKIQHPTVMQ
jgi:cytochrome c-type biogenesis protein CcsB